MKKLSGVVIRGWVTQVYVCVKLIAWWVDAIKIYAFHYMKFLPEKLRNNIFLYLMIHGSVRNQVYGCLQLTVNL